MKPIASNINNNTSIVSSSNDVLWQGGDLPVIRLCKSDSISDVVMKAAIVLEGIKTELDLTDLDLQCIFDQCATCPNPSKTLHTVLTLLINKVCALADLIGAPGTTSGTEPNIILANCFRYTDGNGDSVTQLAQSDYTKLIAQQVCTVLTTLNGQASTLNNHEERITTLEGEIQPPPTTQVSVKCVAPGSSASNPIVQAVDTAFQLLEGQFCNLSTVMGDSTTLNQAVSGEPQPAGNASGVYSVSDSTQALWVTPAASVGQLLQHLDLAINDLRGAVQTILENCCKVTCDDIIVDFDAKLSDDRLTLTLFFITKSKVPVGYTDCDPTFGNVLTITDALGNETQALIKIATEVNNPSGIAIDLSATPIDPSQDYTLSMNACISNGSTNCVKCITKSITYKDTCSYCMISVPGAGGHGLSANVSTSGQVVIIYQNPGDANPSYMSLSPGQSQVIQKSSIIKSVINYGNLTVNSTCGTLPQPESTACFELSWATSPDTGVLHLDPLLWVSVLGTQYPCNLNYDPNALQNFFNALPPTLNGLLYKPMAILDQTDDNNANKVYFKTTASIAATIEAYLGSPTNVNGANSGFDGGAYVKAFPADMTRGEAQQYCPS